MISKKSTPDRGQNSPQFASLQTVSNATNATSVVKKMNLNLARIDTATYPAQPVSKATPTFDIKANPSVNTQKKIKRGFLIR